MDRPILAEQKLGKSRRDGQDGRMSAKTPSSQLGTADNQGKLYAQGLYMKAPPIPGAKESLLKLKEMGYE
jgi:hypothetical protein